MKKSIIAITILMFLGCVVLGYRNKSMEEQDSPFQIAVDVGELLVSSREGFYSVEIYEKENKLIINAQSDAAFFDGAQFIVETKGEIKQNDIEIIWTTLGGGTKKAEDNDFIFAEIKIFEKDKLIFDTKINFGEKAFDIMRELHEREME